MDAQRRDAGRRAATSADVADEARRLAAELRAGTLGREQAELLVFVGDPAAEGLVQLGPMPDLAEDPRRGRRLGDNWSQAAGPRRELGLWVQELAVRFGLQVGVRAGLAAAGLVAPARKDVQRALAAVEDWLCGPGPDEAEDVEVSGRALGEPQGPRAAPVWPTIWLCGAVPGRVGSSAAVSAVIGAVEALTLKGLDDAAAAERVRAAIREALGAWARERRELIRDAGALRERARQAREAGDATTGLGFAERAVHHGPEDPTCLTERAACRRALGDLQAAREDVDAALELPRVRRSHADALRLRGLVHAELGERERAIADLETYLDRVLVQLTDEAGTRLVGPPEADEAREVLARLR